jgi:hypothetical protein
MGGMTRRPRPALVICLVLSAVLLAAGVVAARPHARADEPEELVPALLDGVLLSPEGAAEVNGRRPIAVIVDNLVDARPQVGLDRADLVYELLVEGGITRLMAVYLRRDAEWVEPVRSARTPFLPIARELGAVVGHVGAAGTDGPTDTQTQFGEWGVLHLDEQFNPEPFRRDPSRRAPHNAVTSTVELRGHALWLGWDGPSGAAPWTFKDDFVPANQTDRGAFVIAYGFYWGGQPLWDYTARWEFDAEHNVYRRSTGGYAHIDGLTGEPLTAKNLVVQLDTAEVINGEGHVLYGSLGSGPAYVFQDGYVIEATWTKATREERTRYWDHNGEEVHFNRGPTWVAILPYGSPLTWE